MPYRCDEHPDREGVTLLTNLQNGEGFTMCGDCTPIVLRAVANLSDPEAEGSAMEAAAPPEVAATPPTEDASPLYAPADDAEVASPANVPDTEAVAPY